MRSPNCTKLERIPPQRRAWRAALILVAACLALSLVGVAAAQSARNFDLACRGALTVAGGVRTAPNGTLGLVDAVGQPGAGLSASPNFGVAGGFVQPYSIDGQAVQAAEIAGSDQADSDYMPFIARILHIVRPCVW